MLAHAPGGRRAPPARTDQRVPPVADGLVVHTKGSVLAQPPMADAR